jgi:hypothetical protein
MGDEAGRAVARAAAVERRGLRWSGAPAVPAGRDTLAVPDGMEGGTTGGGEEGEG